ncbi:MAG: DUF4911 domain-containing protein [Desulfosalsimonadaceae bacterium]
MNNCEDKKAPYCTRRQLYRVDRSAVCFIKFIFEGYDGIAQVETIDPYTACIALHVPPGCEADVAAVLADLSAEYRIERAENNPLSLNT